MAFYADVIISYCLAERDFIAQVVFKSIFGNFRQILATFVYILRWVPALVGQPLEPARVHVPRAATATCAVVGIACSAHGAEDLA